VISANCRLSDTVVSGAAVLLCTCVGAVRGERYYIGREISDVVQKRGSVANKQ